MSETIVESVTTIHTDSSTNSVKESLLSGSSTASNSKPKIRNRILHLCFLTNLKANIESR